MRFTKSRLSKVIVVALIFVTVIIAFANTNIYKEISNSIRLYNEVYRHLFFNYVDPIKAEEFTEENIRLMTKELDPYTVFMKDDEKEPLEILTRGSYGGVGLRISMRKDTLTVIAPMEGSPASRANIFPGDQILKVDSTTIIGLDLDKAAKLIRGKIGSTVTLTIRRPGVSGLSEYKLTREKINVKDVSYSGMLQDHIGYIRLSGFSNGVSTETRQAILELMKEDKYLQGLILDLRSNPGGLLKEALAVAELFTQKGDTLLFTKGRTRASNKLFIARSKPTLPDNIKIAVLINQGSASASEIVAGVIQDLDRGIIIGTPSFGKGLVQTIFKIDNSHSVKVTTAKYYIPSGRLIQKPNYLNNPDIVEQTDTGDTLFYSKNGRVLKGGGGIVPDIEITTEKLTDFVRELWRQNMFYSYAIKYKSEYGEIPTPVVVNDGIMEDFREYLDKDGFVYYKKNEKEMRNFEKELLKEEYFQSMKNPFKQIYAVYDSIKALDYDNNYLSIKRGLTSELSILAGGLSERIKNDLDSDPVIAKAIDALLDEIGYQTTLGYVH